MHISLVVFLAFLYYTVYHTKGNPDSEHKNTQRFEKSCVLGETGSFPKWLIVIALLFKCKCCRIF